MTAYLRFEVVRQFRQRDALIWRLAMPAGLYVVFRTVLSGDGADGVSQGLPSDVSSMVVFAVLGMLFSGLFATAPGLARERALGWLHQLRVTPLSAASTVAGKVAAALAFALPSIALVMVAASASQGVDLGLGRWAELTLLLWIATAPFVALGLLIGLTVANPESAQSATTAAFAVLWIFGGMVTNPSDLPGVLETVAGLLPTNAAAELGWAAARGDAVPASAIAVIGAWTVAVGALAALAWRRLSAR